MNLSPLFNRYKSLAANADQAFNKMMQEYGADMKCSPGCSDCCYAMFGLFLIEAVYLQSNFIKLGRNEKRIVIQRCAKADKDISELEKRLRRNNNDRQIEDYSLARERIRCPLLNDEMECCLYPYRPITCRVYGIPTMIRGRAHVCHKSGFKEGEYYPVFDLDGIFKELFHLSRELIQSSSGGNPENASLLISVSKAIQTPVEDIINESFV